jgi:uridine kinase
MVQELDIKKEAIKVLKEASTSFGILATAEKQDNYNRIWARDGIISGLAMLSQQFDELYPPFKQSLLYLCESASSSGQIPSNISVNGNGEVTGISFGGPVGRTDASFWWIIGAVLLLKQQPDDVFKSKVKKQCELIFKLAENWEFNQKNLMYVPMSSNWADEYITHGYVLYDQLLRYWALQLASEYFDILNWREKTISVKQAIQQHFLFERNLEKSLYPDAQKEQLSNLDLSERFVASFSPGSRVERFDAWSIGLLLMLNISSSNTNDQLENAIVKVLAKYGNQGIPAFWPLIFEEDNDYKTLLYNHSYRFKNHPGHFHNGGVWPVINGFLVAGLKIAGKDETAAKVQQVMESKIITSFDKHPFTEYFSLMDGKAGGIKNLCYSASGYLLADAVIQNQQGFRQKMGLIGVDTNLKQKYQALADEIIAKLNFSKQRSIAIAIAGESGSGKTTLSEALNQALMQKSFKTIILHQDEYFHLPPAENHQKREEDFSWVGPKEVKLNLIDEHINIIKHNTQTQLSLPKMNWEEDRQETQQVDIKGVEVVIVEGTYTSFLNEVDYRVFINTNYQQTRKNRIVRGREEVTDFIEQVLEKESKIIQEAIINADIVVDGTPKIVS